MASNIYSECSDILRYTSSYYQSLALYPIRYNTVEIVSIYSIYIVTIDTAPLDPLYGTMYVVLYKGSFAIHGPSPLVHANGEGLSPYIGTERG